MHALCISLQAGGSMEMMDITNANRGIGLSYDQILESGVGASGRMELNTCTRDMFRVSGVELGRLFDFCSV